jgi:selenide, water dikinase
MKNLVSIGGGHSHAIALKYLGLNPLLDVRPILISDVTHTPYSGMLPGHIGGLYSFAECHIDLIKLTKFARSDLILDRVVGLDLSTKQVLCDRSAPISFDWLSIDIGSTPSIEDIVGATEYGTAIKPIPQFLEMWHQCWQLWNQSPDMWGINTPLKISIVGGGIAGIELAMTIDRRLKNLCHLQGKSPDAIAIHLFHRQPHLLTSYPVEISQRLERLLIDRQIHLHLSETVTAITLDADRDRRILHCESGLKLTSDRVFLLTQATAPKWIHQSGLATDERGFVLINDRLQSISHPDIFATGDIATSIDFPRPKAGVFAVRQGKPLSENLRCLVKGDRLKSFHPQSKHLALIGTGDLQAIALWDNFYLGPSAALWQWKNWIDRRFMSRF